MTDSLSRSRRHRSQPSVPNVLISMYACSILCLLTCSVRFLSQVGLAHLSKILLIEGHLAVTSCIPCYGSTATQMRKRMPAAPPLLIVLHAHWKFAKRLRLLVPVNATALLRVYAAVMELAGPSCKFRHEQLRFAGPHSNFCMIF